jgi:hypothetical protein
MIRNTSDIERHLMRLLAMANTDYETLPSDYKEGKRDGIKTALESVRTFMRNGVFQIDNESHVN